MQSPPSSLRPPKQAGLTRGCRVPLNLAARLHDPYTWLQALLQTATASATDSPNLPLASEAGTAEDDAGAAAQYFYLLGGGGGEHSVEWLLVGPEHKQAAQRPHPRPSAQRSRPPAHSSDTWDCRLDACGCMLVV